MAENVKQFRCVRPFGLKGMVSMARTVFFFFLLVACATQLNWVYIPIIRGTAFGQAISTTRSYNIHRERIVYHLNCTNMTQKCSDNYPSAFEPVDSTTEACPDYFRWIHEDLKQWETSGITKEMIERGISVAYNRLVIINGSLYVEKYRPSYQTRDVFTIWGILQLLRLYPGKIPDLELLFYNGDTTEVMKRDYEGPNATVPPPLFHYCGQEASLDIVFPDWSFWGWPEINIKPWEQILRAIKEGSERIKWEERKPYAYWRGNPYVSADRYDLLKCRDSEENEWNVELHRQYWPKEIEGGFRTSNLENQCTHRYKIYIEGQTWSVSEKYILACDSMTLMIKPVYHDFFSRSMVPMQHFWPIRSENKCRHIKFAVEWGNNHTREAQAIGTAGSKYIEEMLTMRNVYDYMFHVLNEYAKLLRFKPTIPPNARRVCTETMACSNEGLWKDFMVQSMVKSPSDKLPCTLPPPYEPEAIRASFEAKEKITKQVETWETEYWEKLNKQQ